MSRHVVVTGASSGIGEALVREFAGAGAAVTLVARRRELMECIAGEIGGRTRIVTADLTQVEQSCDWLDQAEIEFGPIDVLVNNAGVMRVGPSAEMPVDRFESMLRVDLSAPLRITRAVLPPMLARRTGTIVNIASMAALAPAPGMVYYNAAKAGLAAASESLRGELRGSGVNVLTVYPGPVETALARTSFDAYGNTLATRILPIGTTEGLARRIRRAVERGRARLIYPRIYSVVRHFPALTRFFLDRITPRVKWQPVR